MGKEEEEKRKKMTEREVRGTRKPEGGGSFGEEGKEGQGGSSLLVLRDYPIPRRTSRP